MNKIYRTLHCTYTIFSIHLILLRTKIPSLGDWVCHNPFVSCNCKECFITFDFGFQCIKRYLFRHKIWLDPSVNLYKSAISIFGSCVSRILFSAVQMTQSRVYALIGCQLLPSILCWHAIILYLNACESCDSFYLNKWEGPGEIFYQIEGPVNASKSLAACSRWCAERESCKLLSWNRGSCWQVGFCGATIVTGVVYDLKKDSVGWYLILIGVYIELLWINIKTIDLWGPRKLITIDTELVCISFLHFIVWPIAPYLCISEMSMLK